LRYPKVGYENEVKIAAFNQQLVDRVSSLPGVEAAAIGVNIPFDDNEWDSYFHITWHATRGAGEGAVGGGKCRLG
jgi:hypothetical protein